MPRFSIIGRLKVNVNVTVAWCEDATMLGRVKTDNGRFSLLSVFRGLLLPPRPEAAMQAVPLFRCASRAKRKGSLQGQADVGDKWGDGDRGEIVV